MTKVGEHVTLDIIGTEKEYEPKFFEKLVYKISKKAKVTVLEISKYKFEPQGFTLVALLAESHISFHTFPERGIISFDFFTCGKVNPNVAYDILKKEIKHKRIVKKEFNRDTISYYDDIYSSPGLKKSFIKLHEMGLAISVEVWKNSEIVGGLYGLDLGDVFCGESMFSKSTNASKLALVSLSGELKKNNYRLIDCQVPSEHLKSMGAEKISRDEFLKILIK